MGTPWFCSSQKGCHHGKIKPILALAPPQSLKQLRAFIGFVNFYKDYWKKQTGPPYGTAHILDLNEVHQEDPSALTSSPTDGI
jgi:hypothetical protein